MPKGEASVPPWHNDLYSSKEDGGVKCLIDRRWQLASHWHLPARCYDGPKEMEISGPQTNWTDWLWCYDLGVMENSPYSLYLTPTDFYLCGPTMQHLAVMQIATDADVKQGDH